MTAAMPAETVPPVLVAALLGARAPGLPPATRAALLACPRVGGRTRMLAVAGAPPATAPLAPEAAGRAMLLAGAGLHAGAVLTLLRGSELGALADELGLDPRPAALACAPLALAHRPAVGTAGLATAIRVGGAGCLNAWAMTLPPAVALAQWAALPEAARAAEAQPAGAAVLARLMSEKLV